MNFVVGGTWAADNDLCLCRRIRKPPKAKTCALCRRSASGTNAHVIPKGCVTKLERGLRARDGLVCCNSELLALGVVVAAWLTPHHLLAPACREEATSHTDKRHTCTGECDEFWEKVKRALPEPPPDPPQGTLCACCARLRHSRGLPAAVWSLPGLRDVAALPSARVCTGEWSHLCHSTCSSIVLTSQRCRLLAVGNRRHW